LVCCVFIFIHLTVLPSFRYDFFFFRHVLFNIHVFVSVPDFFLLLMSNFILLWSEDVLFIISILFALLNCVLWLVCGLCWRLFYVHLRRMYIQLLSRVFYTPSFAVVFLATSWGRSFPTVQSCLLGKYSTA
jgi:hypothetical protein